MSKKNCKHWLQLEKGLYGFFVVEIYIEENSAGDMVDFNVDRVKSTYEQYQFPTKQEAIDMYVSEEPTPENSMEIVKSIAEQLDQSPNGVRMILTKAGVYVKKNPAVKASGGTGGGRVSVAAAQEELTNAISDMGQEPDAAIIGKLTGKAAKYFAELLNKLND